MKAYVLLHTEQQGDTLAVKIYDGQIHSAPECCLLSLPVLEGTPVYGPFEIELPDEVATKAFFESATPVNTVYQKD